MLISRVPEGDGGAGEGLQGADEPVDHTHDYQTASQLFEMMAKNQNFTSNDVESLTTRDLVLLYKNIDLGTKLMTDANDFKITKPNQYVETVVYNDELDSDGSDLSEIYSNEDLHNVVLINKERIDLLNSQPSLENTLCHKFGDLEIQSSDLNTEYDKHFLFKDPYIKEQLKSLNLINTSNEFEGTILPASLLDYICCKRLEDNYNFYMDNIIRYVKHTIEQLKRISNGDYLTDKAKEKWREVENSSETNESNNIKVLATSTSIPLHVEHKSGGILSKWDDIVHSEVDVRSLSKILEKKIILEIPKLICGSYKLLSKCCAENVIISCQKENLPIEKADEESRVNVVFQLQRSNSGQVISNISSIMILQTTTVQCDSLISETLPLPYEVPIKQQNFLENGVKIVELNQSDDQNEDESTLTNINKNRPNLPTPKECVFSSIDNTSDDLCTEDSFLDSLDYPCSDYGNVKENSIQDSSGSSYALREIIDKNSNETPFNVVSPDELRITIQKLNMQSVLTEESCEDLSPTTIKKKSPTRVRIKSPYENKSHLIEEKKRRRLLEIRERREKKKIALAKNCKISKNKYANSAVTPQPSGSVTKLSITNKSFYNSIYGQCANLEKSKGKSRKGIKKDDPEIETGDARGESEVPLSPDQNSKKYTNRSYYLDDAVTEMMYMEMKQNEKNDGTFSASTSEVSNDFRANLTLLSQLIGPSMTDLNGSRDLETKVDEQADRVMQMAQTEEKSDHPVRDLTTSQSTNNIVPLSTADMTNNDRIDPKKSSSSVECRRSIDKIYDLMKKLAKPVSSIMKSTEPKLNQGSVNIEKFNITGGRGSSTIQGSDSGTSLKHHLTSSNPSCFSFEKNNSEVKASDIQNKPTNTPMAIVPKVIISSKFQTPKVEAEKPKKEHKKIVFNTTVKVPENPLQAISQLLQEFENVQKIRQNSAVEQKPKKPEVIVSEVKNGSRQNSIKRRSRLEQHMKENAMQIEKSPKIAPTREKRPRAPAEIVKNPHPVPTDDKMTKKKIFDIIDEVKEARGEAVKGPSKINSRLNSLAQPKRSYVQAHSEEYQYKYGKNIMADRLQRLAATPAPPVEKSIPTPGCKNRLKRNGSDPASPPVKQPSSPVPPLDRASRLRRSTSGGPVDKALSPTRGPSNKQNNVPETPETLKKKMLAVESYVKNHYGYPSGISVETGLLQGMQMSRVPLLPTDLELESMSSPSPTEEATALGSKLHRIIDTMLSVNQRGLAVLAECQESTTKIMRVSTDEISLDNLSRCDEHISTDSEFNVGIFQDNVQTAVENVENVFRKDNNEDVGEEHVMTHPNNSTTQLETLENALYRHMSLGTFQKRLRIKNLTLTPKQSMQQVVLLQSGDAGSLMIKSTISQNFKSSTKENLQQLKALPVLSKSKLDWNFTKFPVQVATVGYAFPHYPSLKFTPKSLKLNGVSKPLEYNSLIECHVNNEKDSQCFKGGHQSRLQQVAQTDDHKDEPTLPKYVEFTNTNQSESQELKELESEAKQTEKKYVCKVKTNGIYSNETKIDKENTKQCDVQKPLEERQEQDTVDVKNGDESKTPEVIDYTTSLDVLVGLLNEIKKITTCQTNMTASNEHNVADPECKELETILNNAAALENSVHSSPGEIVSITSLDKLRQLESNPSIYSFYLSDDEDKGKCFSAINVHSEIPRGIENLPSHRPTCVDKEVGVDFLDRDIVSTFTDVPSKFLPIAVNHSTNVTSSLIGVISEPSTQSLISFTECHTVYSKTSLSAHKNIIELPQVSNSCQLQTLTLFQDNVQIGVNVDENLVNGCKKIEKDPKTQGVKLNYSKRCLLSSDFDPLMKMKRDILVTVYSLLVFTVFAALSFPELLYHF